MGRKKTGQQITCRLPEDYLEFIDGEIDKSNSANRSEYIRDAVRNQLIRQGHIKNYKNIEEDFLKFLNLFLGEQRVRKIEDLIDHKFLKYAFGHPDVMGFVRIAINHRIDFYGEVLDVDFIPQDRIRSKYGDEGLIAYCVHKSLEHSHLRPKEISKKRDISQDATFYFQNVSEHKFKELLKLMVEEELIEKKGGGYIYSTTGFFLPPEEFAKIIHKHFLH